MASRWGAKWRQVMAFFKKKKGMDPAELDADNFSSEKKAARRVKALPSNSAFDFPQRRAFLNLAQRPHVNPVHVLKMYQVLLKAGASIHPNDKAFWRAFYDARIRVLGRNQPMHVRMNWFSTRNAKLLDRALKAYLDWERNPGDAEKLDRFTAIMEMEQARLREKRKMWD